MATNKFVVDYDKDALLAQIQGEEANVQRFMEESRNFANLANLRQARVSELRETLAQLEAAEIKSRED